MRVAVQSGVSWLCEACDMPHCSGRHREHNELEAASKSLLAGMVEHAHP